MQIGSRTLRNNLFVAPMAGVTDRPFRQLCKQFGAGLAVSEMVASNSLLWGSEKTRRRVFSLPQRREFEATISDTARPAPNCLHSCLKGRSVTPAIGATKRLFRNVREPICIDDHGVFCGSAILYLNASAKGSLDRFARELFFKRESAPRNPRRAGFRAERARRKSCAGRENAGPAAAHRARRGPRRVPARAAPSNSRTA